MLEHRHELSYASFTFHALSHVHQLLQGPCKAPLFPAVLAMLMLYRHLHRTFAGMV